jgi:hypothetical protein
MEEQNPTQPEQPELLHINAATTQLWKKSGNWGLFISIFMLLVGLLYLAALVALVYLMGKESTTGIARTEQSFTLLLLGIFTAIILSTSILHLLFAVKLRQGIATRDQTRFEQSWAYYLNHLRISGVMMGLYVLSLIASTIITILGVIQMRSF